jgi:hypothetical protein
VKKAMKAGQRRSSAMKEIKKLLEETAKAKKNKTVTKGKRKSRWRGMKRTKQHNARLWEEEASR